MGPERSPSVDLSGLEDVLEWLRSRRNTLVGTALVVVLAVLATSFIKRQIRESSYRPWLPLFASASDPWDSSSKDLASVAEQGGRGTSAEPFATYWQALRSLDEKDSARALEILDGFRSRFPTSPLCNETYSGPSLGGPLCSPCGRVVLEIKRVAEWDSLHPQPAANPPPGREGAVTIVTDRGSIVIGLYDDVAPKSCASFRRIAPTWTGLFIATAADDRWVDIGQSEAGIAPEMVDAADGSPPFEPNALSHFSGTVAFRAAPFSKAPWSSDIRVNIATDVSEDGRSTVFAQVLEGMDVLTSLSKAERKADSPQLLAQPLRINEISVAGETSR